MPDGVPPDDPVSAYVAAQRAIYARHSTPEAIAERALVRDLEDAQRERENAKWDLRFGGLHPDEVARRAAVDAALPNYSWQPPADPGCPDCLLIGRICPGCLGVYMDAELSRRGDCEACGGFGQRLEFDTGGKLSWRFCPHCNAPPPYPGMVPGGLADRARARGPAWEVSPALRRAFRMEPLDLGPDQDQGGFQNPLPPELEPKPKRRYGLEGIHCQSQSCRAHSPLPANAWELDQDGLAGLDWCPCCGSAALAIFAPRARPRPASFGREG